jgi:hypothetical protein
MSFTVYDYLKENPRQRDKLIKHNWKQLYDENIPVSVAKELRDLTLKQNIPLTDANLFWNKQYIIATQFEGKKLKPQYIVREAYKTMWPEWLYLQCLEHAAYIPSAFRLLTSLTPLRCEYHITSDIVTRMVHKDALLFREQTYDDQTFNQAYLLAAGVRIKRLQQLPGFTRLLIPLIMWCGHEFLLSLDDEQVRTVGELLGDCDAPEEGTLYNSINQIERAHDARTDAETARLIRENRGDRFIYKQELIDFAAAYSFKLPEAPIALVLRGKEHSNCVGTYSDTQCHNTGNNISRLFFTKDATLELVFDFTEIDSVIICVSTRVKQFKGRFNKDIIQDENLARFRIACVGKPANWFAVKRVKE